MSAPAFGADDVGRTVLDAAGERIGQVSTLYRDVDTGLVAFAGVAMLRRGRRRLVLVPLVGATKTDAAISVTCGRLLARRAPSMRPGDSLPAGVEPGLFAHYDLPYLPRERNGQPRLTPALDEPE